MIKTTHSLKPICGFDHEDWAVWRLHTTIHENDKPIHGFAERYGCFCGAVKRAQFMKNKIG